MKKILICSHWMDIGGAERALLGLLSAFDPTKFQVDLYLCRHSGDLFRLIPKHINILPEDKKAASIAIPVSKAVSQGCWDVVLGRVIGKIRSYIFSRKHPSHISCVSIEYSNKYTYRFISKINPSTEYDLAISFLEPHYITAYKVWAKKKIAWMHTDYSTVQVNVDEGYSVWGKFDAIAAISADCQNSFVKVFPKLESKLFQIENILPERLICSQADEFDVSVEMPLAGIRLLSIGRYCTAKNFDNIPDICARLISAGLDVYWYIIGYGGDEDLIRQKIAEAHVEERVILLGKKENPYPYIKSCDAYVQPSRYEGKSIAVREAQIFCKPVVITAYPTSASQLEDGVDGIIVPMDNEGCAAGIAELLRDPEKMKRLSENCRRRDYTNRSEIEKIYSFL